LVVPSSGVKLAAEHAPAGVPAPAKLTKSPATGVPPTLETVAVTVEVDVPLAVMLFGLAVTATVLAAVCVMIAALLVSAFVASIAVIVQAGAPAVVLDV
jgi:hypothetical protein